MSQAKKHISNTKKRHRRRMRSSLYLRRHYTPLAFDTCPVSPILWKVLDDCRHHGIEFTIISGDRRKGVAERFGHQSQAELYELFLEGKGNPANPPGSSTHEYVNGGNGGSPAFQRMSIGAHLKPHQLGLDFASNEQAANFVKESAKLGYKFFQPYPTTSEDHHLCCRMEMKELLKLLRKKQLIK